MLFKLLKSNQPVIIVIIPLLIVVFWLNTIIDNSGGTINNNGMILYSLLTNAIPNALVQNIIAIIFICLNVFLLTTINSKYKLINIQTYLPSVIYVFLTCTIPPLQEFSPIIIASFLTILAIERLFNAYHKDNALKNFFSSALLLSIGSLFYFNIIYLLIITWIAHLILRQLNWRELFIPIIGSILPYYILYTIHFIKWGEISSLNEQITLNLPQFSFLNINFYHTYYFIFFVYLFILTIIAIVYVLNIKTNKINIRKYFFILLWLIIIIIILIILTNSNLEIIYILAIPITYFLSLYFVSLKSIRWQNISFTSFILISISLVVLKNIGYL